MVSGSLKKVRFFMLYQLLLHLSMAVLCNQVFCRISLLYFLLHLRHFKSSPFAYLDSFSIGMSRLQIMSPPCYTSLKIFPSLSEHSACWYLIANVLFLQRIQFDQRSFHVTIPCSVSEFLLNAKLLHTFTPHPFECRKANKTFSYFSEQ